MCGYSFARSSLPKCHDAVLDSCIGVFPAAGDWRVRPYASARKQMNSKGSVCVLCVCACGRVCWPHLTHACHLFLPVFSETGLELEKLGRDGAG